MRSLLVVALGVLLASPGYAQDDPSSANNWLEWCGGYPDANKPTLCRAYSDAMLDGVLNDNSSAYNLTCVPKELTHSQLIELMLAWLQDHPEDGNERMGTVADKAAAGKYPCS